MISGNRISPNEMLEQEERYAVLDGRINDNLEDPYGPHLMPWISQSWGSVFESNEVPFSQQTKEKLAEITTKAHARHQLVRFWATPDKEEFWEELLANKVDLINNDDYALLSRYLRN